MSTDLALREFLSALDRCEAGDRPAVQRDAPFGARTTYRVGGTAAALVECSSRAELDAISVALGESDVETFVLGNGSNTLVSDRGFPGLVIVLTGELSTIVVLESDRLVVAGGGASYPLVARRSAACGLRGLEWAVGIPGSVGGAVAMNAGGHGSETSDHLLDAEVVDLGGSSSRTISCSDFHFAYRTSRLAKKSVVVSARFELTSGPADAANEAIAEVVRWRREHQPGGRNAGSVFTNPAEDPAGHLIEIAGLKGLRVGSAEVSSKHANFIQADEHGSADDVHALIAEVRRLVATRLGIELQTELREIGFSS